MEHSDRTLRPLAHFENLYDSVERELAFRAETVAGWRLWRMALQAKVAELLGGFPDERCDLQVETLRREERDGYAREKIIFQSLPDVSVPAWVLVPDDRSGPGPAMVASHGHGGGVREIIGEPINDEMREHIAGNNYDYAAQLARYGYVVIAPEQAGWGERREQEDIDEGWRQSSCRQLSFWAMLLGRTAIGLRVWDIMRCIDYLQTRPDVDTERIGCLGLSGGGTVTTFAAAMEERIKAAVISGYFNTWRGSILAMHHCECNYVPGILRYAELSDVTGLIAPRPLLIESGTQDPIFPVECTREAYAELETVYDVLDARERLDIDIFEGEHMFSGRKAFDFLARWL